jgi:LPXTG-site transpeptidase (sortase) family protein
MAQPFPSHLSPESRGRSITPRRVYIYARPHATWQITRPAAKPAFSRYRRSRPAVRQTPPLIADIRPPQIPPAQKPTNPPRIQSVMAAPASVAFPTSTSNKRTKSRKRTMVGAGATAAILSLAIFAFGLHERPTAPANHVHQTSKKVITQSSPPPAVNRGLPTRLKIPKLNIDAGIAYMGLARTNNMEVPSNITDVGWYKYGALPGNKGSAVIAGHLDGPKGQPAVFSNLTELQKGDNLSVVDSKGQTVDFVVRQTRTYDQAERSSEVFNSGDGSHLNLVTCTGAWDASQHRYAKRLVVFTDKA